MSLIDFIAFVAAMLFLLVSRIAKSRAAKRGDSLDGLEEPFEEEIIQEVKLEMPKRKPVLKQEGLSPKAKRSAAQYIHKEPAKSVDPYARASDKDEPFKHLERNSQNDAYALKKEPQISRAVAVLKGLRSQKEMIILNEILSKPKGF